MKALVTKISGYLLLAIIYVGSIGTANAILPDPFRCPLPPAEKHSERLEVYKEAMRDLNLPPDPSSDPEKSYIPCDAIPKPTVLGISYFNDSLTKFHIQKEEPPEIKVTGEGPAGKSGPQGSIGEQTAPNPQGKPDSGPSAESIVRDPHGGPRLSDLHFAPDAPRAAAPIPRNVPGVNHASGDDSSGGARIDRRPMILLQTSIKLTR